jgi:glucose-6-phosphate isomerase
MRITETQEWEALAEHHLQIRDRHLRDLFAEDPERGTTLVCRVGDLRLDFSKNRLTGETIRLLAALAERAGLRSRTEEMFRGEHIHSTEDPLSPSVVPPRRSRRTAPRRTSSRTR